jgi:hypothetical protein
MVRARPSCDFSSASPTTSYHCCRCVCANSRNRGRNSVGHATASARTFSVELSYLGLLLLLPPIPTAGGPYGTPESESFTDNIPCIDKVLYLMARAGLRTLAFLVSKCNFLNRIPLYRKGLIL